jgi:MurNAc alpha-1-phosphate uridylyltransferase
MFKNLMIFAAGLGTRMLPLTNIITKSLVKIKGKPILHYSLEEALNFGCTNIVINTHHLAEQINDSVNSFVANNPNAQGKITLIHEKDILETGGAIKNASKYFDENIIFTVNSDSFTINKLNIFSFMASNWRDDMRALMLVHNVETAVGYEGSGDFYLNEDNSIRLEAGTKPFVYTGLQLTKIDHIISYPHTKFSLGKFFENDKNIGGVCGNMSLYIDSFDQRKKDLIKDIY